MVWSCKSTEESALKLRFRLVSSGQPVKSIELLFVTYPNVCHRGAVATGQCAHIVVIKINPFQLGIGAEIN